MISMFPYLTQLMSRMFMLPDDDFDPSKSQGPLKIYDPKSLLKFSKLVRPLGLKAMTTKAMLEQHGSRVTNLQGYRLSLEDFAQFLNLPVTDKLTQVHNFFHQNDDRQIDIRQYVIALSTICQPSTPMETLKLAFKMYEDKSADVQEEDLATILEIMLGVKEVELSGLFLCLDGPDREKITYDEFHKFLEKEPGFTQHCLDFRNHPRKFCFGRIRTSSSESEENDE
ncbi:lysophosphatidylcholine acyltransferase 1-like isoform X2 [Genypterus blacodes]|uniref:lysophosphatidylcholine acyltransferase 1-like isoform X2 n=2 Tax=Genypterus blacodes TaxID=154954 RepID=UPI003F75A743